MAALLVDQCQKLRGYAVVPVHKHDPLPLADLQSPIPGGGDAPVLLTQQPDTAVPFGIIFTNLGAGVGGSVVNDIYIKLSI